MASEIESQIAEIRARIAADGFDLTNVLSFVDEGYSASPEAASGQKQSRFPPGHSPLSPTLPLCYHLVAHHVGVEKQARGDTLFSKRSACPRSGMVSYFRTFTFAGYQPIVLRYLFTLHAQEYASSAEKIAVDSVALSRTLLTVIV